MCKRSESTLRQCVCQSQIRYRREDNQQKIFGTFQTHWDSSEQWRDGGKRTNSQRLVSDHTYTLTHACMHAYVHTHANMQARTHTYTPRSRVHIGDSGMYCPMPVTTLQQPQNCTTVRRSTVHRTKPPTQTQAHNV